MRNTCHLGARNFSILFIQISNVHNWKKLVWSLSFAQFKVSFWQVTLWYLAESWKICLKYVSAGNKSKCHMATILMNGEEVLTLGLLYTCLNMFKMLENFIARDT